MKILELKEKRASIVKKMRAMLDICDSEKRSLNGSENDEYQKLDGELKGIVGRLGMECAISDEERALATSDGRKTSPNPIGDIGGGATRGASYLDASGHEIRSYAVSEPIGPKSSDFHLGRLICGVVSGNWRGREFEKRALSGSLDTAGGFLLPEQFASTVIDLARAQTVVLKAGASTIPMQTSEMVLAKQLSDPSAAWRNEGAAVAISEPSFGTLNFHARSLAVIVPISVELIEDAVNSADVVQNAITKSMALAFDAAALRGNTGPIAPLGLKDRAGVNAMTGGATFIGYDAISQGVQKVWEANGTPTAIIYSPTTQGFLDRLKDGDGLYLNGPASFEALPKLTTTQIPSNLGSGTNESEIYIGDWSKLLIGMRTDFTVEISRLSSDSAGNGFSKLQALVRVYMRADVNVAIENHFTVMQGYKVS